MFLERLFTPKAEVISTSEDLDKALRSSLLGPTATGLNVNADNAMRVSAVYACVRILAESVGQLPLILYRRRDDGGKERVTDHESIRVVARRPNPWQTSFEWRETMQGHLALRGNAYSFINRLGRGTLRELLPISPDRVTVKQEDNFEVLYEVNMPDGRLQAFKADQILHFRGLSSNGFTGLSPVALHREAMGLAMATEKHGGRLFGNGAQPLGALQHPGELGKEGRDNIRDSFDETYAGVDNAFKTLILEEGMEWKSLGMTNEDSQFLETRKFQVNEIARIFRIPPHMIADLEKATFSNIESQAREFVKYSLSPWLVRWEQMLNRALLTEDEQDELFFEFLVDGFLRGDTKARHDSYKTAILTGYFTRNEVRLLENRNPLPGLDEPLTPMNMKDGEDDQEKNDEVPENDDPDNLNPDDERPKDE